jgi:hypothetical protein
VRVVAGSNPATPTNQFSKKINRLGAILIEQTFINFPDCGGFCWDPVAKSELDHFSDY